MDAEPLSSATDSPPAGAGGGLPPAPVARRTVAVVTGHTFSRVLRPAALWGAVFGGYVLSSALGFAASYKTPEARHRLASTFGANAGINALIGPARQIDSVAGFTAWRSLGVLSLVGAVWGLLTATRLLRGEEEQGRWELLVAGRTTRGRATLEALAGLAGGVGILWLVTAVLSVAAGRASTVNIAPGAALYLSVCLVASIALFMAVGAVAAQVAPTRRAAAGYAGVALGVAYALRMVADSGTGLAPLRWATPLGWVDELRPLSGPRPAALVPIGAAVVALGLLAVWLAGRRDLGTGLVGDRQSRRPRVGLLGGPTGLALRLGRGGAVGWLVGAALAGLLCGTIAKAAGQAMTVSAGVQAAVARLAGTGQGTSAYLGIVFLLVATLVTLVAAAQVSATRAEEAEGRLDALLTRPLSRWRWLWGRLAVAATTLVVLGAAAGVATWVGTASQHAGEAPGRIVLAGLNVVPAAVVVLGAGVLAVGFAPRWCGVLAYSVVSWSLLVELLGGIVNANHWLMDTSVLHHMAPAPAVDPDWVSNVILVAVGVLLALAGAARFGRRDLAGD
ncbi:MAG TPA: hypothetical protein VE990_01395 [Acidimicrobiales bacterium]|nr:hypothetical protein [Acidimicrobiales bacterium]